MNSFFIASIILYVLSIILFACTPVAMILAFRTMDAGTPDAIALAQQISFALWTKIAAIPLLIAAVVMAIIGAVKKKTPNS